MIVYKRKGEADEKPVMPFQFRRTLIEKILIVVLMLIVLSIFLSVILHKREQTYKAHHKATTDIVHIENGLFRFRLDNGFFPSTEQGLSALVKKPVSGQIPANWQQYMHQIPLDYYGKPYRYMSPGDNNQDYTIKED